MKYTLKYDPVPPAVEFRQWHSRMARDCGGFWVYRMVPPERKKTLVEKIKSFISEIFKK